MRRRHVRIVLAAGALGLTSPVTAQNTVTTVTFTMPVNLTQLSPDLGKVRMACVISPNLLLVYDRNFNLAISSFDFDALPRDELPVVSGQLAATLRVVSAIDAGWLKGDPAGSTWQYECRLQGYSTSSQGWGDFSATPKSPALTLNPAPAPVRGSFTW